MEEKWMNLALAQAAESLENGEVPVGCVFVKDSTVVAQSGNLTNKTKNATTHCEINCINSICSKCESREEAMEILRECKVYVTVEPCIMCAHALLLAGVKIVYFGCENEKFGGNGSLLTINSQSGGYESVGGIMKEQAIEYLQRFYEGGNKALPEKKRHRKCKEKDKEN